MSKWFRVREISFPPLVAYQGFFLRKENYIHILTKTKFNKCWSVFEMNLEFDRYLFLGRSHIHEKTIIIDKDLKYDIK